MSNEVSKNCLFWYISFNEDEFRIEYVDNFLVQIDPLKCISGVLIQPMGTVPERKVPIEIDTPKKAYIPQRYSYEQSKSIHNQST